MRKVLFTLFVAFLITNAMGQATLPLSYDGGNPVASISSLSGNVSVSSTVKTIHVPTAGTLISLLSNEEKGLITHLTVTGNISWAEIAKIKQDIPSLSHLDLSGANVADNTIPGNQFVGNSSLILEALILPSSLTSIGISAFRNCIGLKSIVIGNSVTTIGNSAFEGCFGLTEITLGSAVTTIGIAAFRNCSLLNEVVIPNSVTIINNSAFFGCSGIEKITLGTSITTIGTVVFGNSINMKSIVCLGNTPPFLGGGAFNFNIFSTSNVIVPTGKLAIYKEHAGWNQFSNYYEPGITTSTPTINGLIYAPNSGSSEIKPFTIGGTLLSGDITISLSAPSDFEISTKTGAEFVPTNSITVSPLDGMVANTTFYVRLKAGLSINTYTENIALETAGFTTLNIALNGTVRSTPETIHVPTAGMLSSLLTTTEKATITKLTITGNIDARDFVCLRDEMTLLADLNLKDANIMAYNGNEGTYQWTNSYPANEMPEYSFYNQNTWTAKISLKSIHLPTSISSIGNYAFRNCNGLNGTLTIPNSVQTIGVDAFSRTENVEKLILGTSVTTIKINAFAGMSFESKLKTIVSLCANPPTLENDVFTGKNPTVVYVPIGSAHTYKAATGWSSFNIVEYKIKPTTKSVSSIKLTSAKLTGSLDVITDSPVSAHGFCWNTTGEPTISDSKVDYGATTTEGAYSNTIDNFNGATTYYVRAFATDGTSGTVYGDEISFSTAEIPATSSLSGNFYNSQYWPKSKSPYTITGNVNLALGTTLTIEPGVVINFAGAFEIMTMGNIIANGTANDSITFNANGNICTLLNFKNAKLSDSELKFLNMKGYKRLNPQYLSTYSIALKSQGTCTDSLFLSNSKIISAEIYFNKSVLVEKSQVQDLVVGYSTVIMDSCQVNFLGFGNTMNTVSSNIFSGNLNFKLHNSKANNISLSGSFNNTYFDLKNTVLKSSNLGNVSGIILNSKLDNVQYLSNLYDWTSLNVDSTIFINSSIQARTTNNSFDNCIFTTDSIQNLSIGGTITKSQFIGNSNKLGGVGLDAVSGTISNSSIVNHRIGLQTNSLTISNSNLINNSQYAIKNTGTTAIDAKNNYWGVSNTTTVAIKAKIWDYFRDMNLGIVSFNNFLTTPNTDAPISPPQNFRKSVAANGVNYSWNANPETDIKGYKLYYGAFDGFTFANVIDLGNVTSYNLATASINDTVLVTAYDLQADGKDDMLQGHESWYSEDVIMPAKPGSISGLTTVCQGKTSVSYSVPVIANANSYRWTLPTGATGVSTTRTITVDYSLTAVSGRISVRGVNEYGEGDSTFVAVVVNALPDKAGPITGAEMVCQGEKSVVYKTSAVPGATTYRWTLPEGVTGVSNADTIKVDFSRTAMTDTIRVNGVNDCGLGVDTFIVVTVKPLPVISGGIVGSNNVCVGNQAVVYKVSSATNAISYNWILPNGSMGVSNVDSIAIDFAANAVSGDIKVVAINDCGVSDTVRLAITVKPLIGSIGTITGENTVCAGSRAVVYSIPTVDNATKYIWTLPNGVTGASTTKSIAVDFANNASSGKIWVRAENDCNATDSVSIDIIVKPLIGTIGEIIGTSTLCAGEKNVTYTVPAVDNALSYEWTLPTGATGTSTSNSIIVDYSNTAVSGNITVKAKNDCGETQTATLAVTVKALIGAIGTITGENIVCAGEMSKTYSVPAVVNALSYEWTLPTGATGTSTSNSIIVDYANTVVSGNITVKAKNDCGETQTATLAVTVKALIGSIGTITGESTICAGEMSKTYSVPAVVNALSYEWTLPTGATGTSTSNSIIVDYANTAVSGNITVKAKNDCGETQTATLAVTVKALIGSIGTITGENTVCAGEMSKTYSVPAVVNALSYEWTLPTGATGTSTSNSIIVDYSNTAVSGNITVKAKNDCGETQTATLAVTVNEKPTTPIITITDNTLKSNMIEGNQWYNEEGLIVGAINQEYIPTVNGEYYVIVSKNGCSSELSNIIRVDKTSTKYISENGLIKIYPNPVRNEMHLEYDGETSFEIVNLIGQVIYKGNLVKSTIVETSQLFPGVYFVKFSKANLVITQKFIKD